MFESYLSQRDPVPAFSLWSNSQLQKFIQKKQSSFVLEIQENQIAAFIFYQKIHEVLEVGYLETNPLFRGQGIMKKMILDLKKSRASQEIWLEVHAKNQAALSFYQALGFHPVGLRRRYYADQGDAVQLSHLPEIEKFQQI